MKSEKLMADIEARGERVADGWRFEVRVSDESGTTRHEVSLKQADYDRLTGGKAPPDELVRQSFAFLLEREPKEAIMRTFDLAVIGRYFPEYEDELRSRFTL